MAARSDLIKGLQADLHKWYWESADPYYKSYSPIYPKIADVRKLSEIKGPFYQTTSALGLDELPEKKENESIQEHQISEGYTIYIKKRTHAIKIPITYELSRDFWRAKDFLRDFIKKNGPQAVLNTFEKALANIFNYGGYTSGADIFDNSIPGILSPSYGNLCYDGKPFFTLQGNERSAKNGDTYYNGLGLTLDFDNLKTAHNLLTGTNAKREDGSPFDNTQNKIIVVPTQLALDTDRLINSTLIPDSNNNDKNPLKGEYEIIVNPHFTTSTSWAIGRKGFGIVMFLPDGPTFDVWEDMDTKQIKANILVDFAIGVTNWRGWVGSNFPTSA